jgi:hypothetical protein
MGTCNGTIGAISGPEYGWVSSADFQSASTKHPNSRAKIPHYSQPQFQK